MVEPAGFSATVERAKRGDRDALAHLTQRFQVLVGHACQPFLDQRHHGVLSGRPGTVLQWRAGGARHVR